MVSPKARDSTGRLAGCFAGHDDDVTPCLHLNPNLLGLNIMTTAPYHHPDDIKEYIGGAVRPQSQGTRHSITVCDLAFLRRDPNFIIAHCGPLALEEGDNPSRHVLYKCKRLRWRSTRAPEAHLK